MIVPSSQKKLNGLFIIDSPLISLILANVLTIILAITGNWSFSMLLWIYWFQSVIIGLFNFIKILSLNKFTTNNFQINNQSVKPTKKTQVSTALFFAAHYGFFHFVYAIFLLAHTVGNIGGIKFGDVMVVFIGIMVFFFNHLVSFIKNFKADIGKKQNIGRVLFFPYARIIPMHITIVLGFSLVHNQMGMLLFLILKTLADVIMHQIEHA